LKATEQPVDTGTAAGKAFLDMLGVFAEFETNLRRERQLEAISAAKARGVYNGRKPSIDAAEVRRLHGEEELGPATIERRLGIGWASVYRLLSSGPLRSGQTGVAMPIRPEMRRFYPNDWPQISQRVRFERAAGICQGCGRPHGMTVRCLPDGRWFDATLRTWRNGRGRHCRPPLE
jgi:Resolvase, N terminal domain